MSQITRPFESSVKFTQSQIELMISEIGEILEVLHRKGGLLDYPEGFQVDLLHKDEAEIRFHRSELLEVKRFVYLFKASSQAFCYLTRNPVGETRQRDVVRTDRIMGAISQVGTRRLAERGEHGAVCVEIYRDFNSPGNRLLCNTLLAAFMFCNRYLDLNGALLSDPNRYLDKPIIDELEQISLLIGQLMSSKFFKEILENGRHSITEVNHDLNTLKSYALANRLPRSYLTLVEFFEKWRDFVWVESAKDAVQRILRYYFFDINDQNKLFESWVCFKVLKTLTGSFDLVMLERRTASGVLFAGKNDRFRVRYQKRYPTGWKDEKGIEREVVPDIVIESRGRVCLVIDAKNSCYDLDAYRKDMAEYLSVTRSNKGLLIHSEWPSDNPEIWTTIRKEDVKQEISWTRLIPEYRGDNDQVIARIADLVVDLDS